MIRKGLTKYVIALALALGMLIAAILLPGLIGTLLSICAGLLSAAVFVLLLREDKRLERGAREANRPTRSEDTAQPYRSSVAAARSEAERTGPRNGDGRD